MEFNEVKILVEKYLDGNTSLEEEKLLSQYFSQCEELPDEFRSMKMLFTSLNEIREATPAKVEMKVAPSIKRARWRAWSYHIGVGVAASVAVVMLLTTLFKDNGTESYPGMGKEFICYVDGKQVDDWAIAHAETNRILGEVASNMEQAMSGIRRLHIPVLEENKN